MDFSERFDREKKSGKKFLEKELVVAVIILALILGLYFTGNADFILDLI
jgi:hypothetical protein